jgi:hypothetical protein
MYSQEKAWHSERNLAPRQFQPQKFIMSELDCLEIDDSSLQDNKRRTELCSATKTTALIEQFSPISPGTVPLCAEYQDRSVANRPPSQ